MTRRHVILFTALAVMVVACGSSQPSGSSAPSTSADASAAPAASATPAGAGPGRIVIIKTGAGVAMTFDVTSCDSPGKTVINLQGSGPAGALDLRASGKGRFEITGPEAATAVIDVIDVTRAGAVTASGTVTLASAPDAPVPFQLDGAAGTCDEQVRD